MGSTVRSLGTSVLAFAITALASCGGDLVRLGDGPIGGGAGIGAGGVPSGGGGGGSSGTIDPAAGAGSCLRGQVAADEVLWIGDTWVLLPQGRAARERVRDHARAAQVIDDMASYASAAEPATFLSDIVQQYEERQAGTTKVKVLLMDGGTWDTIIADMTGETDETAARVVTEFQQFLARVASDGTVEHIVYFLMPERPGIPGVRELRPGLQATCEASTVPCHFLDLQPLWEGHPEYTDSASGIQPSEEGAAVIGDELWRIMVENCIAQ
jgi:hypothetical protein